MGKMCSDVRKRDRCRHGLHHRWPVAAWLRSRHALVSRGGWHDDGSLDHRGFVGNSFLLWGFVGGVLRGAALWGLSGAGCVMVLRVDPLGTLVFLWDVGVLGPLRRNRKKTYYWPKAPTDIKMVATTDWSKLTQKWLKFCQSLKILNQSFVRW